MSNAITTPPAPTNEPIHSFAPGSPERAELKATIADLRAETIEIPAIIGGKEVTTGNLQDVVEPHAHGNLRARAHMCGEKEVADAIEASQKAFKQWSEMPFDERAAIFLKAADLLAGPWRQRINASTMLGQSKTCFQAEIDAACELIDFLRFNVSYARQLMEMQPDSQPAMWNRCEYRALEGFVFAVTPFNFTSIAGNLPTAPAIMGNVSLWKPSTTSLHSNYLLMKMFQEAGLPDGVVNFVPGHGADVGTPAMANENLAGIHFTGSTPTFQRMWRTVGENIANYKAYPRLVGETGGKDFIFAHPSACLDALVPATLRGAYEYQGQKCSAASRAYIPKSLWNEYRDRLVGEIQKISMGDPTDFSIFMGAVIDKKSFDNCKSYLDKAKADGCKILAGGECDDSVGYFVQPTLIEATDPKATTMCEEIFGPIMTVYVYDDDKIDEALELCDTSSAYALTGAIFSQDRNEIVRLSDRLRYAAGNFYVNDKPTGAVVGQQPFGGGRASGTNDKAGSLLNLIRWTSVRTIKENFVPPTGWDYPHMAES